MQKIKSAFLYMNRCFHKEMENKEESIYLMTSRKQRIHSIQIVPFQHFLQELKHLM